MIASPPASIVLQAIGSKTLKDSLYVAVCVYVHVYMLIRAHTFAHVCVTNVHFFSAAHI